MWASNYWPDEYWAPEYWAKAGADPPPPSGQHVRATRYRKRYRTRTVWELLLVLGGLCESATA